MTLIIVADEWFSAFEKHLKPELQEDFITLLNQLIDEENWPHRVVVATLLTAMLNILADKIGRYEKRPLLKKLKADMVDTMLVKYFESGLCTENEEWIWISIYEIVPSRVIAT